LAAFIAHSGDSWFWGIGLGIVWLAGDADQRSWSLKIFGAIVLTAVAVLMIKLLVRRQRPQGEWGSIYRNTDPHSFPSGHAARATLLTILIFVLGPSWLILPMAIWAPLVALARVSMGLHYISDIIAGGILGSLSAVIWLAVLN
jgi:undecaprenyl-diphosphatase